MPLKNKKLIIRLALFLFSAVILIYVPVAASRMYGSASAESEMTVLSVWEIDTFEGGKGSRATYLQKVGKDFYENCYVTVTSLTAEAARANLKNGTCPDLISYGAGIYGIENYLYGETPYYTWCNGGYCILTVNETADFSDVNASNTVINVGVDNLSAVAAVLNNLGGAKTDKPTGAYVRLINGEFKYLFGTQRDIYRLKTRGVAFKIQPATEFNDLYQNISITTSEAKKQVVAQKFIDKLLADKSGLTSLGLMSDGNKLYDDEMRQMEGITYGKTLRYPLSETMKNELLTAAANSDVKKLKSLLN